MKWPCYPHLSILISSRIKYLCIEKQLFIKNWMNTTCECICHVTPVVLNSVSTHSTNPMRSWIQCQMKSKLWRRSPKKTSKSKRQTRTGPRESQEESPHVLAQTHMLRLSDDVSKIWILFSDRLLEPEERPPEAVPSQPVETSDPVSSQTESRPRRITWFYG